jgi:hypothetical protein
MKIVVLPKFAKSRVDLHIIFFKGHVHRWNAARHRLPLCPNHEHSICANIPKAKSFQRRKQIYES